MKDKPPNGSNSSSATNAAFPADLAWNTEALAREIAGKIYDNVVRHPEGLTRAQYIEQRWPEWRYAALAVQDILADTECS